MDCDSVINKCLNISMFDVSQVRPPIITSNKDIG